MTGDHDEWAVSRDVANHFKADAGELPPPPKVKLEAGVKCLTIPAETWGRIWEETYGEMLNSFEGRLTTFGLAALTKGAKRIGLADWAGKLEQFRAGMNGTAYVTREDGSLWSPKPVMTISPQTNSITKPIPVLPPDKSDYLSEKQRAYEDASNETFADVLAHFARIEDLDRE